MTDTPDTSRAEALFEEDDLPPARFMFMGQGPNGPKWFSFPCPGARGKASQNARCMVPLSPQQNSNGASWQWNGDRERPTLTPSINCHGCWHGFIRDGEITPDLDGRHD